MKPNRQNLQDVKIQKGDVYQKVSHLFANFSSLITLNTTSVGNAL